MNKYGTLPGSLLTYPVPILKTPNPNGGWDFPLTEIRVNESTDGNAVGKYHLSDAVKALLPESVSKYLEAYEIDLNDPNQRSFVIQRVYQDIENLTIERLAPVSFSAYFENLPSIDFDQLPESTLEEREVKLKTGEKILVKAISTKLQFSSSAFVSIPKIEQGKLVSMEYVLYDQDLAGMSRVVVH